MPRIKTENSRTRHQMEEGMFGKSTTKVGEEQLKISYRTELGHLSLIAHVSRTFSRYESLGEREWERVGVSLSLSRID